MPSRLWMRRIGIRSRWLAAVVGMVAIFIFAGLATPQQTEPSPTKQNEQAATAPQRPVDSQPVPLSDAPHDTLGEAIAFARKGDCDAAVRKFQQVLQEKPKSPDAYAGLARCYLKDGDVDEAEETINKGVQVADGPPVRVALGEVYFRQGKIPEAEKEWVGVINSGRLAARAYLDVARVRRAIEMNKSAKAMIDKAHELDPDDPDIKRAWLGTLQRSEMIKYYEESLAARPSDAQLQRLLTSLKEPPTRPASPCRLVSQVKKTETALVRLMSDPKHLRGYGLSVELNGRRANIMLDTGASGIVVKSHIAEKAGIAKLTETRIGGIGDKGPKNAYIGTAKSIRIGELEFQDCPVRVMEARSVTDEDGLIGADVFEDFLVEIDFPNEKLKLSELPKRPGQSDPQLALKNDEDSGDPDTPETAEGIPPVAAKETVSATNSSSGPQDRYIAPEMQSFTRIFRFGHDLLIPTRIGDAPSKLFLLDTGALTNSISPDAAREVTKVHGDSDMKVKGISGSVKNVYSANKAVIQFGRLRQENQDMLSFDTTSISNHTGTEVSGFLGFTTLRFLDIKIDYRDALIDFTYDAKRFGR